MRCHKSIIRLTTLILIIPFFLLSCYYDKNNNGYPGSVEFPPEGGVKIAYGLRLFVGVEIEEGAKDSEFVNFWDDQDSVVVKYHWLTVVGCAQENGIKIIVEPTDISKKRSLRITGFLGDEFAEIDVIQKGK